MDAFEVPVGDEQEYKPQVGDSVVVVDPEPNDLWNNCFLGTIHAIREDEHEGTIYTIKDGDGDCFEMDETKFELTEE